MSHRRVAITGYGAVSGFGINAAALWDGMREARSAIRPIHNIPTERLSAKIASEIDAYVQAEHFEPKQAAILDRVGQLAVVSAREAVAQCGLVNADFSAMGARVGVIYGASPGQITLDEAYVALYEKGASRIHPFSVPKILPAGCAAAISIEFGAHGPCFATASACATGTHSIGLGFDMIRSGRLDVCIGGGSDASIVYGYIKGWEALRLLATDTSRPFSRDRTGLVLGEAARGAAILGEIVGFGMSADAKDMVAPDAASAARAMISGLQDAGLTPADIGYVNAHGTGTRVNDRTECLALNTVFNGAPPPTSSLKSQVGHTLNASGALETVATLLALRAQIMPATISYREPDPDCPIDCIPNQVRPGHFDYAMTNSLGFGGLNAVLVLRAVS
jgi:nodulation protein E